MSEIKALKEAILKVAERRRAVWNLGSDVLELRFAQLLEELAGELKE